MVNAAGPWAESFLRGVAQSAQGEALATKSLRLVKGSHIVVPRLFEHDHAYIFQNPDKRIIFAIPYQGEFTLIGTTDIELTGDDPGAARIAQEEIDYLCTQASRYFEKPIVPADVVWTYSGVRPLLDDDSGDPSAVTRDYMLESNTTAAPLLSVWGGKITTFRKLAEDAADEVGRMLGQSSAQRRPGPTAPFSRAATCRHGSAPRSGPTTISNASCRPCKPNIRGSMVTLRAASRGATAPASRSCWATRSPLPTWATKWRPACTSANCASCRTANGP